MAAYQTGSLEMPRARQGQIMTIGLALSIGLGLVLSYLLEWSIGVAVACLVLGGTLLFVSYLSHSSR